MASRSAGSRAILAFRLLAPYLAIVPFWLGLRSAWLTILAYHAFILIGFALAGRDVTDAGRGSTDAGRGPILLIALLPALAGPLLYFLLPHVTRAPLGDWLADHGLPRGAFLLLLPYFGLLHPVLEQRHWAALRARTWTAHVLFAGYHGLVLADLLAAPWLLLTLVLLAAASGFWHILVRRTGDLRIAVLSHGLADLGIILAAWARLQP